MRRLLLVLGAFWLSAPALSADQPWFAFTQNELIGFKDAHGKVMIEPKFSESFTVARRFDHIIAAGEDAASGFSTYYLLKDGRQIKPGSVYFFDARADCESEGTIRFRDRQAHKVGFLDQNGREQIAAKFDAAEPLRNGVAPALRDATLVCADQGVSLDQCEHKMWLGGQKLLIDQHGETLVEDFNIKRLDTLDWYSLLVSDQPPDDARRVWFKGVNGRYYSFIDIEEDFAIWLGQSFLPHLDSASLQANSYPQVWYGAGEAPLRSYRSGPAKSVIARNASALRLRLAALRTSGKFAVRVDDAGWPFEPDRDPQYFDGCANFAYWKTPKVALMENWNLGVFEPAKHASFDFIRTPDGYRLVSFSLPTR